VTESQTPEEIRRDIEETRTNLGYTLEGIEDRVSPARIKDRRVAAVRSRMQRVRESVMGSADDMRTSVSQRGGGARDTLRSAPQETMDRARGNPLAAGLIAFGGGLLLASLIPASGREQEAAQALRDRYEEPVREELKQAGQQAREGLQPAAQEAAQEVRSTAQDAAQQTKEDARASAETVRSDAERARDQTTQT
jgi:gas vesicle protein